MAQQAQLDVNQTLFNVMTAINVAGYDAELESPSNSPARKQIRDLILSRNLPVVAELKRYVDSHKKGNPTAELSQYISFALSVEEGSEYRWRFRSHEIPPDAASLDGFGDLMARFHREANLDELWQKVQPALEPFMAQYHEPVTLALQQIDAYLRIPSTSRVGRSFRVYLDIMAAPNQIQARSYAGDFYLVLTPSQDMHLDDIRHAYLTFQLDDYATKFAANLEKKKPLIDLAQAAPLLPEQYKTDFLLLSTKSLVYATEARLAPSSRRETMVKQALGEGYILAPYFFEALAVYEKQESAMSLYYPEMIDAINLRAEDKRLTDIQFLTTPVLRTVKVRQADEKTLLTGPRKTLEEAEDLYDAKKIPESQKKFQQVLDETAESPVKAQAYYGLARIAALEKNPELSYKLFEEALKSDPEPLVKVWSHIYLGRLSGLAGEDAEAIQHFEEAIRVEGASPKAKAAADAALKEIRKDR